MKGGVCCHPVAFWLRFVALGAVHKAIALKPATSHGPLLVQRLVSATIGKKHTGSGSSEPACYLAYFVLVQFARAFAAEDTVLMIVRVLRHGFLLFSVICSLLRAPGRNPV